MRSRMVCLFLILCLAPLGSIPSVSELEAILNQLQIAVPEAEKALNELEAELKIAKSLQKEQSRELGLLRNEATALIEEIKNLKQALGGSATQLVEAGKQLRLVETQTDNLKLSFEDYQKRTAKEIRRKKTWRTISLIEALIILAGGFFVVSR